MTPQVASRRRQPRTKRLLRHGASERGAVTVELAVIAVPVLVAFLLAASAVGRIYSARTALGGVTRDAARAAVTATSAPQAVQLAAQQAQRTARGYGMDPARLTVTTDPDRLARGGILTVTAAYQLDLMPGLDLGLTTITLADQHAELVDPHRSR